MLGRELCPVVSFAGRVAVALGGEASSADAVPAWKHKHDKATTTGLIDFIANLPRSGRCAAPVQPKRLKGPFVPCGGEIRTRFGLAVGDYHLTGKAPSGAPMEETGAWSSVYVREGEALKIHMLSAMPKVLPPAPK